MKHSNTRPGPGIVLNRVMRYMLHYYKYAFVLVVLCILLSAIATVGLTTGITTSLSSLSQVTLILLMFAGRLGVMTLAIAFGQRRNPPPLRRPTDKILIG